MQFIGRVMRVAGRFATFPKPPIPAELNILTCLYLGNAQAQAGLTAVQATKAVKSQRGQTERS